MDELRKKNRKITETVQFKFIACFFALILALLALLNTYPLSASRDLVFSEKEKSLLSQASVVSSSLSALDNLSKGSVSQVMELLDVTGLSRIVVTDATGRVLYDTAPQGRSARYVLFSEISRAITGEQVFWSHFSGGAFVSRAALPVYRGGAVQGAVYLSEFDSDRAELIVSIQSQMRFISLVVGILAVLVTLIYTKALTARITTLASAMRVVRSGDYEHRTHLTGNDELTELGEEFNNLTERLDSTEKQRRRFVSDASHELKTPLAAIRLLTDSIMQTSAMDERTMREFVSDIGSEADRLQRTTEKLLDLSRRDDGRELNRSPVDIASVIHSTLRLLIPLADERGITLEVDTEGQCLIMASEDDIYQIIFNLVENAIKYNVDGGSVHLAVLRDGDKVRMLVEDTGIGIPEADREQVFSRFYRVDKARSRASGGSGLGLSIVHDAVVALGGEIEVTPNEPQGTCFVVTFPACESKAEEAAE